MELERNAILGVRIEVERIEDYEERMAAVENIVVISYDLSPLLDRRNVIWVV